MKNREEHLENARVLISIAANYALEPLEACRAIAKIFSMIPSEKVKREHTPTKAEREAAERRTALQAEMLADPRLKLKLLLPLARWKRPDNFEGALPAVLTVEDAAEGLTPPPVEPELPALPAPPSPGDWCHCSCRRCMHESNGGCVACGRCHLFTDRDEAFALRQDAIHTKGGLRHEERKF